MTASNPAQTAALAKKSRQRRTGIFPANFTTTINASEPVAPLSSTEQICEAAFQKHQYASLTPTDPAEVCADHAATDGRKKLNLASDGYRFAGDDAAQGGFDYKAAVSYSRAAVLEHILRKLDDARLAQTDANNLITATASASAGANHGSASSFENVSNEVKAFTAFQKIGDYVAMNKLRKNLGAAAQARFPELSDVEKVQRYNFHNDTKWNDVSTPSDFGVIEKTLNSGNILRVKFDTDLQGMAKENLANTTSSDKNDLKDYGNSFVKLIDLSPTFRNYFYENLERHNRDYTIRVALETSRGILGYSTRGETTTQTIFPHQRFPFITVTMQIILLHEFSHNVQPGMTKDSDGTTVLRPHLGNSHDREQTAFMGGVINEYNHFLAIARTTVAGPDALGDPFRENIDFADYCEDLMLAQAEWKASKGAGVLDQTATAIEKNQPVAALHHFLPIATSDQIDIRMYNAESGHNITAGHIGTYNLAELTLQQLLLKIDRVDWFASRNSTENKYARKTMGKFLNLLVEQGPANANEQDWRTTINGAFNYLSMDPKVEIPGYAYANRYPDTAATDDSGVSPGTPGTPGTQGTNGTEKTNGTPDSLIAVMAVMSIVIAGLSLRVAKSHHDERSAATSERN